jgi:hypothetical protein
VKKYRFTSRDGHIQTSACGVKHGSVLLIFEMTEFLALLYKLDSKFSPSPVCKETYQIFSIHGLASLIKQNFSSKHHKGLIQDI